MRLLSRKANQNDAIRLINACGIRGLYATQKSPYNQKLIQNMFQTSLEAAEKDIAIVPAVGMGVWKGDPEIYWGAFFDAIIASEIPLEAIYVNPGHRPSPYGKYKGCTGEEFLQVLKEYQKRYGNNPKVLEKLSKVKNLHESGQDVIQLARRLKLNFPEKTVSVLNASDPDVTLGFHVGEYTNNIPHTTTTEENYTALGTNGLLFETITGVHTSYRKRIHGANIARPLRD
jgi:hypothetical protein